MKRDLCVVFGVAGLAMASTSVSAAILNGDFQTGTIAPSTSAYLVDATMTPAGTYNIATFDTFHPSWADFFDHTFGDSSGRYMVVNGLAGVGGMAWAQTVSVDPGADYSVAAWFASVYGFATSSLQFRIVGDGTTLSPVFGAPGDTSIWEQTDFEFNTGTASSISVQIWDTTGVGDGNDYAIDDITLTKVPAPGTMAFGAFALLARARRRR